MLVKPIKTDIFREGDDLASFIVANLKKLKENSILVITQKIVSLAEGRVVEIVDETTKEQIIRQESQYVMRTKYAWLTIRDGMVTSAAGVDESNANEKLILLPKNSFMTAEDLRMRLMKRYKLKKLGVLITDSRLLPLRAGIVGVALGYAGFKGLEFHKGKADIFGRPIKSARTDVADSLAAVAVLAMGEGDEKRPLAIIEDADVEFKDIINQKELLIDIRDDRYQPLFEKIKRIKIKKGPRYFDL
jgi:coenzyme F420-0:L-glutamate ligase